MTADSDCTAIETIHWGNDYKDKGKNSIPNYINSSDESDMFTCIMLLLFVTSSVKWNCIFIVWGGMITKEIYVYCRKCKNKK